MTAYTVHEPDDAPADPALRADGVAFVKEGVAWWALFLPVIWMLYHRMWIVLAIFVALLLGIHVVLALASIGDPVAFLCTLTVSILFAVQANDLRRWTLERRGYRMTGAVSGDGLEDCELKYFSSLTADEAPAASALTQIQTQTATGLPPRTKPAADAGDEIIGLFPDKA